MKKTLRQVEYVAAVLSLFATLGVLFSMATSIAYRTGRSDYQRETTLKEAEIDRLYRERYNGL